MLQARIVDAGEVTVANELGEVASFVNGGKSEGQAGGNWQQELGSGVGQGRGGVATTAVEEDEVGNPCL